MAITRVVPALIQVANNVTSTTIGNTTSIPSLTFDASGVIIAASNTTLSAVFTLVAAHLSAKTMQGLATHLMRPVMRLFLPNLMSHGC